jgi:hypothetical protein
MRLFHFIQLIIVSILIFVGGHVEALNPGDEVPGKRAHHDMVYNENSECIMLFSGSTSVDGQVIMYNDAWCYNGNWKKVIEDGDKRSGLRTVYHAGLGKIFCLGGFMSNESRSEFQVFNEHGWRTISKDDEMRTAEGGMVYDRERNKLIAFGGSAAMGQTNDVTWEWDGSWKKMDIAGPTGRLAFAMVYDSRRKVTTLFGGMGNSFETKFGDTWEYDGLEWRKISDEGPGPRMGCGYTYDSKRGLLIIFGGAAPDGMKGDTWAWDGKAWTQLATTGPSPRMMGYMAYDKKRDRVVLFGGRIKWPNDSNDTWEWDGKEWREIK